MTKQELDNLIIENIYTNDAGLITGLVLQQVLLYLADYSSNKDELMELFLSKLEDDTAQGFIEFLKGISVKELAAFLEGIEVGPFSSGPLGSGAAIKMVNGTSYAEVDHLLVRQKATFRELIIETLKHIGGQLVLSPARMKCVRVVDGGSFYKCYFDTGDGEVSNEFVAGDLARCQVFTGSGTKFYWRLVTLVGEDWINLSKTSAAVGSDAPEAGDDIVQLGNATDTTRQSAIILSTVGVDAPSWKQYSGINSFSLEGKETTVFSKLGNRIQGKTVFTSGGANLDDHLDGVAQDILDALQAAQDAEDKAQQAIEDAEANVGLINAEVGKLQAQLDGEVSNWFYPYTPTLANYPTSDWTTNEIKDRHIGDTFTNTAQAPATDAGKSWRFVKNGSVYSWTLIADSDAVKALLKAAEAQATADGKSTTFLIQPTKYHLGDMWVLNADQTINGIAYKQGDILTATQDSATYNQAHWVKRVRYTDDTAVNELEIGGRNLLLNSNFKTTSFNGWSSIYGTHQITENGYLKTYTQVHNAARIEKSFTFNEIGTFTFSVKVKTDVAIDWHNWAGLPILDIKIKPIEDDFEIHSITFENLTAGNKIIRGYQPNAPIGTTTLIEWEKLEKGNKPTDWTPAPEDVQAEIDAAVVKATYWSVKASAPVIYKDAINASTSGTHTPVTVSGELRSGTTTTQGGFITVTPNGGTEAGTASASPVTIAPADSDGKTSYTVRLYDTASKTTLLDTMTIPVVFKGASGVNAISAVLSNEADVLPASSEGVVSDYSGSGTDIIVYEGGTRLTYGTGNGQFQVSASGSGISVGSASTVSGNIRRYANASNMTSDNATITFTITGKTASGASFSLTKVQSFAKSRTGQKGADGVSITLVDVEFAKNTNPTTAPTTGWTTTAPSLSGNEQLWTRTKTAYSSGSPTYSTPANITPKKGDTGAVGQGIDSVTEEFAISTSKTTQPTTGWSTTQPTWVQGQYIWSRVKVVYKNPADTIYTGYAVSSEWEAINELEIGGRNYLLNSGNFTSTDGWYSYTGDTMSFDNGRIKFTGDVSSNPRLANSAFLPLSFIERAKYQVVLDYECDSFVDIGGKYLVTGSAGEYSSWGPISPIKNIDLGGNRKRSIYAPNLRQGSSTTTDRTRFYIFVPVGQTLYLESASAVQGDKPMLSWTPAPEDVQAEIDSAKQEALSAASDAQSTADSLKNFTDTAFRDGIIDRSESIAIEKYKNSLNEAMSKAEASYMKVFLNTYLPEGAAKSDLEQAKINLWGQRDTLLSAINTAISGGITTPAQKTAVDNAFSTFNNLMTAFQNALEEANKAIQAKLDNISKGYVDELEIGGRNLALNTQEPYKEVGSGAPNKSVNPPYPVWDFEEYGLVPDDYITITYYWQVRSLTAEPISGNIYLRPSVLELGGAQSYAYFNTEQQYFSNSVTKGKTVASFKIGNAKRIISWMFRLDAPTNVELTLYNVKLEKGTKATDWTPAPEDVDQKISDVDAKANQSAAITDKFKTTIDGGLINTVMMLLREANSTIDTAGISGIQDNGEGVAFWAGGTHAQAIAGTAKAIIRHDGSSKFTDTEITGVVNATSGKFTGEITATSGTIGGFKIGSAYIGAGSNWNSGISGMSLWDDFIVFNKPGKQAVIGTVSDTGFNFLGRFRDTTSQPYYTKTGVIINISGGYKNNALDVTGDILLNGNMSLQGAIDGLSVRTRQISTTTYLTSEDVYVSCYNSTSITVYLPSSPVIGKVIFIRTINAAAVTINGNGKTINWGTGTGANRGVGDGVGDTVMLVYDGQFWLYNYMIR